jgi:predicted nucleic acid-binding protein
LPWITVQAPADQALVAALKMLVDDGEAEAIALAREQGWRIVVDDRRARSVARRLEISVIGTVGVLVRAKRSGIIPSLKTVLHDLEAKVFYISGDLREQALRLVDE